MKHLFLPAKQLQLGLLNLIVLLLSFTAAKGQNPNPWMTYDIMQQDSIEISACDFPFATTANYTVGDTETFEWEVVKGKADYFFESTQYLQINDFQADTLILAFNVWSQANNLVYTDSITYTFNHWPCDFIEDGNLPLNPKCGDTLDLSTNLNNEYNTYWSSNNVGNGIEILDDFGHTTRVVIKEEGNFFIDAMASTWRYNNSVFDYVTINATCDVTPPTQAEAGNPVFLSLCEFPYLHQAQSVPVTGETSNWKVISGAVDFTFDQSGNLTINDATSYLSQIEYSITNGDETTKDTLIVDLDNSLNNQCDLYSQDYEVSCNDTIIIYSYLNNFSYNWEWIVPSGAIKIRENIGFLEVVLKDEFINAVEFKATTPYGFTTYSEYIGFNVSCPQVNPVTQANVGFDIQGRICELPISNHQVTAPGVGETSSWRVLSGSVEYTDDQNGNLTIEDGFDYIEMEYSITDGVTTTKDTLQVNIENAFNNTCEIYSPNTNVGCKDTVTIYSYIYDYTYLWNWVFPEGTEVINSDISFATIVFNNEGDKQVSYEFTTPRNLSNYTKYLNFSVSCFQQYSIEGTATIDQQPLSYGIAYLMSDDKSNAIPVDTTFITNGNYIFDDVELGVYTVYVVPFNDASRGEVMTEYLPTYYVNKARRNDAHVINVHGNTTSVDIRLIKNTVDSDSHELEVELPYELYKGPIPIIIINENGNIVCAALPIDGVITFDNLVNGTYFLEIPTEDGFVTSKRIEVTSQDQEEVAEVSDQVLSLMHESELIFSTYPNPFKNNLVIDTEIGDQASITVFSSTGAVVYNGTVEGNDQINTENWLAGAYIVKIVHNENVQTLSVVKQ